MKTALISSAIAVLAFALGWWCGRYPISKTRLVSFWARRREALRRDYGANKNAS
jgi:hypothetical protein